MVEFPAHRGRKGPLKGGNSRYEVKGKVMRFFAGTYTDMCFLVPTLSLTRINDQLVVSVVFLHGVAGFRFRCF